MLTVNPLPQKQIIGWIVYNDTFIDVPECYFDETHLPVYQALKQQYFLSGKIEPTILSKNISDIIVETEDIAFPKNNEPIISALEKEYRRINAWKEAQRLIVSLEDCKDEDTDEIIINHSEKIINLMQGYRKSEYKHDASVDKFISIVEENKRHPGILKGIQSNLPDLDKIIRGWQHGKLYVIGGLKKTGKSRFAINLVSQWIADNKRGVVFSMEMNENDIHACVLGNRLNINTSIIGTSELSDQQLIALKAEAENYKKSGLIIDRTSSIKVIDVKNQILRERTRGGIDFVVIDYIQRMHGEGERRVHQIEYCITRLADIARDENVIMIVLSQLSGAAEHKNDSPIYSFFKESQAIIEACDCALVLFDENRGEEKPPDGHEIKCTILQRDGVSDYTLPLFAQLKYSRFSNVQKIEEPEPYYTF